MNPTLRWAALAAAVLGLGVSVFVAACGGDDDEESSPPAATTAATTTQAPPTTTESTTTESTTTSTTTTTTAGPETIRIAVVGGKPQGGIQRPKVSKGDRVVLVVTSDVADEIHLHGYDLSADAGPGKTARIAFVAKVPGRFEIELEERGVQIGELEVRP
jgi:cytoskeletal protein RodZ